MEQSDRDSNSGQLLTQQDNYSLGFFMMRLCLEASQGAARRPCELLGCYIKKITNEQPWCSMNKFSPKQWEILEKVDHLVNSNEILLSLPCRALSGFGDCQVSSPSKTNLNVFTLVQISTSQEWRKDNVPHQKKYFHVKRYAGHWQDRL